MEKDKFKTNDVIVCIDISNKPFRGKKKPDIKTISKHNSYVVQEKDNPYNDSVFVINDRGEKKSYSTRRFVSIQKFRNPKIKKLKERILNG